MSNSDLGKIEISATVIADIAGHVLRESYGVTGIVNSGLRSRVRRAFGRPGTRKGIRATRDDNGIAIDVHIAAGRGVNLAEVAANVKSAIVYQVERLTQLPVYKVDIHIDEVKAPRK